MPEPAPPWGDPALSTETALPLSMTGPGLAIGDPAQEIGHALPLFMRSASSLIKVKQGLNANLPAAFVMGEPAFTTDTFRFFMGTGSSKVEGAILSNSNTFTGTTLSHPGAGTNSENFGAGATSAGLNSVAFGQGATAAGANSGAIGQGSSTGTGGSCFIFGNFVNSSNRASCVVIGLNATASANSATAVGTGATAGASSFGGGAGATASGANAAAVGGDASAAHAGAVSIGRLAASVASGDISFGGFGSSGKQLRLVAPSTTDNSREQLRYESSWVDSTDASRTSQCLFHVIGNASKQEYMKAVGNASGGVKLGFFGVAAVVKPAALTAADNNTINSGDATTDTIIANMRTRIAELEAKLQSLGLLT